MTAQAMDATDSVSVAAHRRSLVNAALLVVVGVLATTLAQPQALARLPLTNMLKNELHLSRSAAAGFFFLAGLAWYFKPLAGIVTDAFPIFGSRRRSYLIVSTMLATLSWVGLYFTPHQYNLLLWMCILLSVFMVVASTVVGGFMVEIAQASGAPGKALVDPQRDPGGRLDHQRTGGRIPGQHRLRLDRRRVRRGGVLAIAGDLPAVEGRAAADDSAQVLANFKHQLGNIASARTLWAAAGLTALVFIAPGLATALFYKQQNELHMNTVAQGYRARSLPPVRLPRRSSTSGPVADGISGSCFQSASPPAPSRRWATCSTAR